MTDRGADGGWRSAVCPGCGRVFVWTVVPDPNRILHCTETDPNTGKACTTKMPRADWEYLAMQQRKGAA